jgi:hypothetical protein
METAETFMAGFTATKGNPSQQNSAPATPTFIMMPTPTGQFVQPQIQLAPQVQQSAPIVLPVVLPQQANFRARQFGFGGQQQMGMPRGRLVGIRPGGGRRRPGGGRLIRQQRLRSQGLQQQLFPQVLQPIVIQQPAPPAVTQAPETSQSIRPAPTESEPVRTSVPIIHQHVIQAPPIIQQPAIIQPQIIQQPAYSSQPTIQQVLQQQYQPQQLQYHYQPQQASYSYPSTAHYVTSPTTASITYTMPSTGHGLSNTIVVQPYMSERERKKKKRREKMIKKLQAMME